MDIKKNDARLYSVKHEYYVRPRIRALLAGAVNNPLVVVCAGAGYGKTRAVYDFVRESGIPAVWVQFSELDNMSPRFWESFVHAYAGLSKLGAEMLKEIGLPDSEDKFSRCFCIFERDMEKQEYLIVLDDFHLVNNPAVIRFIEKIIYNKPPNRQFILICREIPQINIASLQVRGLVTFLQESDLNFTENELAEYFNRQGLSVEPHVLHQIRKDTDGWAFSVNLVAQSLKKSPGYSGYTRSAMKQNIFMLIETEVWNAAGEELKRLWTRLSLIEHLSADLIAVLAGEDMDLLAEFKRQNAYVRLDNYVNAYMIHQQFLDFLRAKQGILTDDEKRETYRTAAHWCKQNDFVIDALNYYEKIGDYESIAYVFTELPSYVPYDVSQYAIKIFEHAPTEAFDRAPLLAAMHLRVMACLGRLQEYFALAEHYEHRFLRLPEDDVFRNLALGLMYFSLGCTRTLMCAIEDCCDFDEYYVKADECLTKAYAKQAQTSALSMDFVIGAWGSLIGSAKPGIQEEHIKAVTRMVRHASRHFGGVMAGADTLCRGELLFYQGDMKEAEPVILEAASRARENNQFDIAQRALFYIERIGVSQGNRAKVVQALDSIKALLNETKYFYRFMTFDIAIGWYYYLLDRPEMVPDWLKGEFAPYSHAYFMDNFGNQMKARYHYMIRNYQPLLTYIDEMKQRESILYGRIEMLSMEACARYQMKDKTGAWAALRSAYEEATQSGILTPFMELGKNMRSLTASALRSPDIGIPRQWLETVNRRSAAYARHQALVISDYEKEHGVDRRVSLSPRETEVLRDLYRGLSRSEIAFNLGLSESTVKMVINNIYGKLNANSITDVVRIAAERKLV